MAAASGGEGDAGHRGAATVLYDDMERDCSSSPDSGTSSRDVSPEPNSGSAYDGVYETREQLGHGFASVVHLCVDRRTAQRFAVKIVDVSRRKGDDDVAKLAEMLAALKYTNRLRAETINEARLLKSIPRHANIIELRDFFVTSSFLFVVFELAPLGELYEFSAREVVCGERRARKFCAQICAGLAHLHANLIVHRDLKLENVLCISEERVVIADFGFAVRLENEHERRKELCGTTGYMAPEMLVAAMFEGADGYGREVDNWALGVIAYTLLAAGMPPFYHRREIREGRYTFPPAQFSTVSESAKDFIRAVLVTDVKARPTAAECLEHPWLRSEVLATKPTPEPPTDETARHRARRRWNSANIAVRFAVALRSFATEKETQRRTEEEAEEQKRREEDALDEELLLLQRQPVRRKSSLHAAASSEFVAAERKTSVHACQRASLRDRQKSTRRLWRVLSGVVHFVQHSHRDLEQLPAAAEHHQTPAVGPAVDVAILHKDSTTIGVAHHTLSVKHRRIGGRRPQRDGVAEMALPTRYY